MDYVFFSDCSLSLHVPSDEGYSDDEHWWGQQRGDNPRTRGRTSVETDRLFDAVVSVLSTPSCTHPLIVQPPSYPAVYLVCIAPISISRWLDGSKSTQCHHSPAAVLSSHAIFSLSGVFNVILFSFTRPSLVTGSTESLVDPRDAEVHHHQDPSEDTRQATDLSTTTPVSTSRNKTSSFSESRVENHGETAALGSPTLLPRLQTTFPVTRDTHVETRNYGRLPH